MHIALSAALFEIEQLRAERDAATKKAEQLLLSRYFTRCREGAFDHSTDCATWGDDGQGNVDGKPVHPPCNCGASWNWAKQMEAERDAARAGESRAVEALKRCHEGAARQLAEPRDHNDDQYALTAIATECDAVLAAQGPAIDWLAQQRREAAVEALEEFAYDADGIEELITCNILDLRSALRTRAAAIGAGEVKGQ